MIELHITITDDGELHVRVVTTEYDPVTDIEKLVSTGLSRTIANYLEVAAELTPQKPEAECKEQPSS